MEYNPPSKIRSVSPIRLSFYLSLIRFKSICSKQSVLYLRMVSPCSEGGRNSSSGAIGERVRLLIEKLVVRVNAGA